MPNTNYYKSIGCQVEVGKYRSEHTIAEDLGITLGAGLKKFYTQKIFTQGINIYNSAPFGLDEAKIAFQILLVESKINKKNQFTIDG
jgi:imidazoleglycerol phosphate dehydratase HisB